MMTYELSEEVQAEIEDKTRAVFELLGVERPEGFTDALQTFHTNTRNNEAAVKHLVHKKLDKLKADVEGTFPLSEHLEACREDKERSDALWEYLHVMYLLLENACAEPNQEILAALVHRLDGTDKPDAMRELMNKTMTDLSDELGALPDLGNMRELMDKLMTKSGIKADVKKGEHSGLLKDIMGDIKDSLNKNADNVDKLFESTKNIGKKYQEMIAEGKLSPEDLVSSMMGMLTDPEELSNALGDLDLNKLPDPQTMMGKMMAELGPGGLDLSSVLGAAGGAGGAGAFDPMSMISKMMGGLGAADKTGDTPLTEEQLREMEEFYASLNVGDKE
jgi:hypothetical protein